MTIENEEEIALQRKKKGKPTAVDVHNHNIHEKEEDLDQINQEIELEENRLQKVLNCWNIKIQYKQIKMYFKVSIIIIMINFLLQIMF